MRFMTIHNYLENSIARDLQASYISVRSYRNRRTNVSTAWPLRDYIFIEVTNVNITIYAINMY